MNADAFDGSDDATGLEVEGCPTSFVVDDCVANEDYRMD